MDFVCGEAARENLEEMTIKGIDDFYEFESKNIKSRKEVDKKNALEELRKNIKKTFSFYFS